MTAKDEKKRCHETFHSAENCPDCAPEPGSSEARVAKQAAEAAHIEEVALPEPEPAAVAAELTAVAFTPGLADAICRHGKPIGGCVDCAKERARVSRGARAAQIDPDRASRLASSAKSAAVGLGKTRFRLDRLRVSRVNLDSEPSKSLTNLARSLGHERPEGHDWTDIVITVTDTSGNVFEVGRVTCKYDGMLGESHAVAELVCRKSWGGEDDDDSVSCPLCYERGHGAGACPRN